MPWLRRGERYIHVASTQDQAEQYFMAVKSLLNGRDPKAQPG